ERARERSPAMGLLHLAARLLGGDVAAEGEVQAALAGYLGLSERRREPPRWQDHPAPLANAMEKPPVVAPVIAPLVRLRYDNLTEFVGRIVDAQDDPVDRGALILDLIEIFRQEGLLDTALELSIRLEAIEAIPPEYRFSCHARAGAIHLERGDPRQALREYELAEAFLPNQVGAKCSFYEEKAKAQGASGDFQGALESIEKAGEFGRGTNLDRAREYYEHLLENEVNLRGIDNPEVRNTLRSAGFTFLKLSGAFPGLDHSLVIVGYCKAVEVFLNEWASERAPPGDVVGLDTDPSSKRPHHASPKFWRDAPLQLKDFLREDRTVSLGQWVYIFRDCSGDLSAKETKVGYHRFLAKVKENLAPKDVETLRLACERLAGRRNSAAHSTFFDEGEFSELQPEIVKSINQITSVLKRDAPSAG
ncbi:MAG: tetratricopeptide repeat protein, partial [Promethearchaeota archaeon]